MRFLNKNNSKRATGWSSTCRQLSNSEPMRRYVQYVLYVSYVSYVQHVSYVSYVSYVQHVYTCST